MKKLILGLLLSSGILMASNLQKDDLLQFATAGKSMGSSLEMSKTDMKKADGGFRWTGMMGLLSSYSSISTRHYISNYRVRYSFRSKYYGNFKTHYGNSRRTGIYRNGYNGRAMYMRADGFIVNYSCY